MKMPSPRIRAGFVALLAALAIVLVVLSVRSTTNASAAPSHVASIALAPSPAWTPAPAPQVVSWGGTGDQLALVVRNTSTRQIVHARLLIVALDKQDHPLLVTSGQTNSTCCVLSNVPPDGVYGAFATIKAPLSAVHSVTAQYLDLNVADVPSPESTEHVDVSSVQLRRTPSDTIVSATVRTTGKVSPYLSGQAFLVDPHGHLVGVISGQFYCFGAGAVHRLHMQLLHPVPAGTRVQTVVARPLPRASNSTRGECG